MTTAAGVSRDAGGRRRRRGGGRAERAMVPDAQFTSYYGRPILKPPTWKADIPAYFFLGGLAAGSSVLGAGADLTGNQPLTRTGRLAGLASIGASFGLLVHDLGRPSRFLNMLRVAKPTSPMSVGTWILAGYGPAVAVAAGADLLKVFPRLGRAAGLLAAALAPAVASYTAVLIADTAVPSWHDAYPELPFVFVGSAAASAGGLAMIVVPPDGATPGRRLAVLGAALEIAALKRMESRLDLTGEPYSEGRAGQLSRLARFCNVGGAGVAAVLGRRSRPAAMLAGAALVAGSAVERFAVFTAGVQSAKDPKYTVVPQRRRLDDGQPVRADR